MESLGANMKTKMKNIKSISYGMSLVLLWLCLAACSSPHFRKAEIPSNMGLVYIYRPKKFLNGGMAYPVNANGYKIDTLMDGGYITYAARAGRTQFTARNEITNYVTLDVEPGQIYYIKGTTRPGSLVRRPHLQVVSSETGEEEIESCRQLGKDKKDRPTLPDGSGQHEEE
jgi:hypothetical protein